ncbi:hypothetical protein NFI96_033133 [Prochilodus magdalenae]|nr:hypothetical protein NFI96_033133 [Prochilodus magdalenae]
MTDSSSAPDATGTPDPAVVDPAAPNGEPDRGSAPESFSTEQEMKISEVEDKDLLESSLRLKPHEAQSYRKKALWVSWVSIVVTLILAIAAFSE